MVYDIVNDLLLSSPEECDCWVCWLDAHSDGLWFLFLFAGAILFLLVILVIFVVGVLFRDDEGRLV